MNITEVGHELTTEYALEGFEPFAYGTLTVRPNRAILRKASLADGRGDETLTIWVEVLTKAGTPHQNISNKPLWGDHDELRAQVRGLIQEA